MFEVRQPEQVPGPGIDAYDGEVRLGEGSRAAPDESCVPCTFAARFHGHRALLLRPSQVIAIGKEGVPIVNYNSTGQSAGSSWKVLCVLCHAAALAPAYQLLAPPAAAPDPIYYGKLYQEVGRRPGRQAA